MRRLIILCVVALNASFAFGQKEKRDIHKGNQMYEQQKYKEAEAYYKKSVDKSRESLEGNFNLADAWYKQKKYDEAAAKFANIAASAEAKDVKAKAYHNLGNTLLESNKLEESIEAYKKSLMNNPKDNETRYNLAYAQAKLRQQQQQQNKDDKNKDSKDKQGQNKNDQNKDRKDEDQDQKNKDKQDQKSPDQNKNQGDKKDQKEQQTRPDQLSKEDAERMLEALKNEERNTQEKMKNKKGQAVRGKIVKDW